MDAEKTIESRVADLETAVKKIQVLVNRPGSALDWLNRVAGSMKDYPEFDRVLELGREFRDQDRPEGDES